MRTTALFGMLLVSACLGGQSKQARDRLAAVGDQSQNVPPATRAEHDWRKAAQGHGAAGPIPAAELDRMEKESAPGGDLSRDGGR